MARFTGWRVTRAGIIFIIVAVVLAALVFAGVRFAQIRGEQARQNDATEVARQNQESSDTPAIAETTPEPAEEAAATTEEENASEIERAAASAPSALPQTGPSDLLPILLLAGATYYVVRTIVDRRVQIRG